jgi:hypothetical protein
MKRATVLVGALLPLLAACAQSDIEGSSDGRPTGDKPVVLGTHPGLPDGLGPGRGFGNPVAAIVGSGRLVLTTWGSGGCPWTPVRMEQAGPGALRVVLGYGGEPGAACTADMAPTTARLGVDPALTRDGQVELIVAFTEERMDVRVVARPLPGG